MMIPHTASAQMHDDVTRVITGGILVGNLHRKPTPIASWLKRPESRRKSGLTPYDLEIEN